MDARLAFLDHALVEGRCGLIVDACLKQASGHAKRLAALTEAYRLIYALWTNADLHKSGKTMQCHYAAILDWSKRGRDELRMIGEMRWPEVTKAALDLIGDRRTQIGGISIAHLTAHPPA